VLLNLDVVLHERHYREPLKNSVPGGRLVRTTLQLFRIMSECLKLPAPFRRRIAEPLDADAAVQAAFNGGFAMARLAGELRSLGPDHGCTGRRLLPQTMLLADRGYDADWVRELARQQGAWANIPPKRNRKDRICFSPFLYRARNLIERFFNRVKQCRRVATRYDKLAANYLTFVKLASIRIWLRANESAS
jgi:transposase